MIDNLFKSESKKRTFIAKMDKRLEKLTIQALGLVQFQHAHNLGRPFMEPSIFSPSSMHYSIKKMATLLGLGSSSMIPIPLDENSRQSIKVLKQKLEDCLNQQKPVMMVIGVLGNTAESSVDSLEDILALRDQFRQRGLNFWVHAT